MRIAVPVSGSNIAPTLKSAEGFRFYEDDHGRITREFFAAPEEQGIDAAVALLERYSVDALLCAKAEEDERRAVASAGLMLFPTVADTPEAAAFAFLSGSIFSDPNNTCNACAHRASCASGGGSCSLK